MSFTRYSSSCSSFVERSPSFTKMRSSVTVYSVPYTDSARFSAMMAGITTNEKTTPAA